MTDSFKYQGGELVLFQYAKNWKEYFSQQITPYINGNVLETGAGIGATTLLLNNGCYAKWLLLEPDKEMSEILDKKFLKKNFLLIVNYKQEQSINLQKYLIPYKKPDKQWMLYLS